MNSMLTTAEYFQATLWALGLTGLFALLTIVAFLFQWGFRFRLVGVTGFMGVLTSGLFALSLTPTGRTIVPGAAKFSLVYDGGGNQAVIAVAPTISETELEATLRQAASNLYSSGRLGQNNDLLTIRARTILHEQSGVSELLYLGDAKRSLLNRHDDHLVVTINRANLARLPKSDLAQPGPSAS